MIIFLFTYKYLLQLVKVLENSTVALEGKLQLDVSYRLGYQLNIEKINIKIKYLYFYLYIFDA